MPAKVSHRTRSRLELGVVVCIVITLTVLDIRDLNYKINWLGPYISYRFAAVGPNHMQPVNLTLTFDKPSSGSLLHRPSGWSSFLDQCENMSPVTNGKTFRALMGHNCKIGTRDNHVTYQQLIMSSSARVDSVAWACCQLLEPNRCPPVCNSDIVRGFEDRYNLDPVAMPDDWVTLAGSIEEAELLNLLDVIGASTPLTNVMCVEGVEYLEPGQYYTTVLGCGAPNYFRSAFAGHYATKLREIHRDLAYLTVDNINLMNFHFKIRENCVSDFKATLAPHTNSNSGLIVTHTTTINFSSYGQLYALMIVVDTILMVVNLMSALQLASHLVIPAFRSKAPHADAKFAHEGYAALLTSSLNRSPVVIALLIVSQLLSWLIIIPNAVMWTWGNSQAARIQAYLSSVRTWTLILIVVNAVWDLFVFAHEKLAFVIAQHTFLMNFEIIAVGSYVSYYNRAKMFAIAEAKYRVEKQRSMDSTSFGGGFAGAGNAFNKDLDHQLNTPTQVLYIVYQPLFIILLYSVIAIFAYAVVKGVVIYSVPLLARRVLKKELFVVTDLNKFAVSSSSECEPVSESSDASRTSSLSTAVQKQPQPNGGSDRVASASARSFGTAHLSGFGLAESSIAENAVMVPALPAYKRLHRGYARLPLEELLNVPIRARSLVRTTFSLDHVVNSDKFVAAQLYLEFGVFFVAGRMKSRWGFLNPVPPVIQVNDTVISDLVEPLTPVQQLSRLRSAAPAAMAMAKR
ncbi:hypothetical protein Gpo141_00010577 [Globisporangium polare]